MKLLGLGLRYYYSLAATSALAAYHGIYIHIGKGSYIKVGGGRDLESKYIKCKRRDGDVQSRGGTSPLSRGGRGAVAPCPLCLRPCMLHRPTYTHRYFNTLLSVSVILFEAFGGTDLTSAKLEKLCNDPQTVLTLESCMVDDGKVHRYPPIRIKILDYEIYFSSRLMYRSKFAHNAA